MSAGAASTARIRRAIALGVLMASIASCQGNGAATPSAPMLPFRTDDPGVLAPRRTAPPDATIPALATRRARVEAALGADIPILPLAEPLDAESALAQDLALHDPAVAAGARDEASGAPLRAEVLGVRRVRPGDLAPGTAACGDARCYRVEIYNHARRSATVVVVDVTHGAVVDTSEHPGQQPDIPPHLVALARDIAAHSPEVPALLGFAPAAAEAMMAGTKTALNDSACERSRHLCVAPTFVQGDQALWAIVDLTDGVLVGTRWTDLGQSGTGPVVTERGLEDDVVAAAFCDRETTLSRGDWAMRYVLTSSDGLRLSRVSFKGRPVLDDAKLVDWHVSYSGDDAFGYSDAIGCPTFSQAAVVAHSGPRVEDVVENGRTTGFALTQDFTGDDWPLPCNYAYRQRYAFNADGGFRAVAGNLGRGCGTDGVYRPVLRLALAGERSTFAQWDGAAWRPWAHEGVALQGADTAYSPEGYLFRITDGDGRGFYVEPGRGQFGDGGRGDNAYTYVTLNKPDVEEGQADLITIGPCCNTDDRQGPEKFIGAAPDPIAGGKLVLWYVPQMANDDTPGQAYCWAELVLKDGVYVPQAYPCFAGPAFVPIDGR